MLRIEVYPALGGLVVRVAGSIDPSSPAYEHDHPTAVTRLIQAETVEALGIDEAVRDVITDVMVLWPGLVRYALY